jgi:mannosylglycerate hydrolase
MATQPMNMFVDVSDGEQGIAFLSDSLTEYEVMDNEERTVALSLLRAVGNWICTETRAGSVFPSQHGGQCPGRHEIRYGIRPHAGGWIEGSVDKAAQAFNAPCRIVQTRKHAGKLPASKAPLFAVEGDGLRASILKRCETRKSFVLRIYNPTGTVRKGAVAFHAPVRRAWQCALNEKREKELKITKSGAISISAAPYEIITIEVQTGKKG